MALPHRRCHYNRHRHNVPNPFSLPGIFNKQTDTTNRFALYLPNSPSKIWTFTQQQHDWLKWNYERDMKQTDDSSEVTAMQGFLMAARDPKTWLMCGTLYATYTAAAVNNFFPTVVAGLGFSRNATYGLTAPPVCEASLSRKQRGL